MDEKQLLALYESMKSTLDLGDFKSFKGMVSSDEKYRKAFYDTASETHDIGDYNTFSSSFKKKVGGQVSDQSETVSVQGSPLPSASPLIDPISDLLKKRKQILEDQKSIKPAVSYPGMPEVKPRDFNTELEAIDAQISSKGIDPKRITTDFSDVNVELPDEDYLKIYSESNTKPQNTERQVSAIKWHNAVRTNIKNEPTITDDQRNVYLSELNKLIQGGSSLPKQNFAQAVQFGKNAYEQILRLTANSTGNGDLRRLAIENFKKDYLPVLGNILIRDRAALSGMKNVALDLGTTVDEIFNPSKAEQTKGITGIDVTNNQPAQEAKESRQSDVESTGLSILSKAITKEYEDNGRPLSDLKEWDSKNGSRLRDLIAKISSLDPQDKSLIDEYNSEKNAINSLLNSREMLDLKDQELQIKSALDNYNNEKNQKEKNRLYDIYNGEVDRYNLMLENSPNEEIKKRTEKLNSLVSVINSKSLPESEINEYNNLVSEYKTLLDSANNFQSKVNPWLDFIRKQKESQYSRYPSTLNRDVAMAEQEWKGEKVGPVGKFIAGFGNVAEDAANIVPILYDNLFASPEQKLKNDFERLGLRNQSDLIIGYQKESDKLFQSPLVTVFSDNIKSKLNVIENDTNLSDAEKESRVNSLLKSGFVSGDIYKATNPRAGNLNLSASSVLNTFATVAPQFITSIGLTAATGGGSGTLFLTTAMQAFSPYYDEAVDKGIANPVQYATALTLVDAATELIGTTDLQTIKKIMSNKTGFAAKFFDDLTELEFKKLLAGSKGAFKSYGKAIKSGAISNLGESGEEYLAAIGGNIVKDKMFNEYAPIGEDAVESFVTTSIGSLPLNILGVPLSVNQTNIGKKFGLYNAAADLNTTLSTLKSQLDDGKISTDEYNDKVKVITEYSNIIRTMPKTYEDGSVMRDDDRVKYAFNQFIATRKKQEGIPPSQEAKIDEATSNALLENDKILQNATSQSQVQVTGTEGNISQPQGIVQGQQEVGQGTGVQGQATQPQTNVGDSNIGSQGQVAGQELSNIERLTPEQIEVSNDATGFADQMQTAQSSLGRMGMSVTPYVQEDYDQIASEGGKFLRAAGNKVLALLKPSGEMVSLVKDASVKAKGAAQAMISRMKDMGGLFMDNYDIYLTPIYEKAGYKVVARVPFNEEFAPEGWNAEDSPLKNKPDVVFMVRNDIAPEQAQTFTDYKEAQDYTQGLVDKAVENGVAQLPTQIDGVNRGLAASIPNVAKSLEKLGLSIQVVDEATDTDAAMAARGNQGLFVSEDGAIIIDRSKLKNEIEAGLVVWHEASHPVMNIIRNTNKPLYDAVVRGLNEAANNNYGVSKALSWARSQEQYDNVDTQNDEAIVETIGKINAGLIDINSLDTGLRQKLIDFVNSIAKFFGIDPILNDTDLAAFKKTVSQVADALKTGRDIAEVVGQENVKSFENKTTQAKVDERLSEPGIEVDRKEKLPLKISPSKEQETIAKVNELINKYPNALTDRNQWKELMSRVFTYEGTNGEVLIPAFPEGLSRMASSVNEVSKELAKVSDEQRKLASDGLKGTKEIGKLYEEGKMDEVDTGLYFLWNIMSIGISPYPQESGFLQAVDAGVDRYIDAAANGKFDDAMLKEYLDWANTALPKGTPGAGSKSNLNSFGTNFLAKASDIIESGEFKGKTRLQALHEIISDRKTPTNTLRKKWHANMSNMQFNNKIFDFILLTTGRSDLFVVDRVRVDHFWDGDNMKKKLGLNPATSIYDGSELSYKASDGAGFSKMLSDVPGMVFTELANRAMADVVAKAYKKIGVNSSPDVGRFHWETWVAASAQEVSHGSIDAIVQRKDGGKIKDAGIRQGKYGAWDFNFKYRKIGDQPFRYEFIDNNNNVYIFDDIRFVKEEIDNQAKKTYGSEENRFLIKDSNGDVTKRKTGDISKAWYDQPGVDSQKYFDFLRSKAKEVIPAPNVVEDQGVIIDRSKVKDQASVGNRTEDDLRAGGSRSGRIQPAPIKGKETKKLKDIIFDVVSGIKQKTIYTRTPRALGSYNPSSKAVKIRFEGDLDTTAHEIGHSIDDEYGVMDVIDSNAKAVAELDQFSPFGSKPPKGYPDPKRYIRGEGFAEFLRAYMVNPDATKSAAPELSKILDNTLPDGVKKSLDTFSDDIRAWAGSSAVDQIAANVQIEPEKGQTLLQKLFLKKESGDFSVNWVDRLGRAFLDSLNVFDKAIDHAKGLKGIDKLMPSKDPMILARLLNGFDAKFGDAMKNGMFNSKLERLTTTSGDVMNVEWLVAPLADSDVDGRPIAVDKKTLQDRMKKVISYMIAERTVELSKRFDRKSILSGIGAGIFTDVDVAERAISEIESDPEFEKIKEAASRYREMADETLKYMVDKGRIANAEYDKEGNLVGGYEFIKKNNLQYVAMQRIFEAEPGDVIETGMGKSGSLGSKTDVLKRIKGSSKAIVNPYIPLLENIYKSYKESDRNEVLKSFRDLLVESRMMGEDTPVRFSDIGVMVSGPGNGVITIFVNGKPEYWKFQTDVYNALKNLDSDGYKLPGVLTALPRALRWSVTNFPTFAIRNFIRDFQHRSILSGEGNPIKNVTSLFHSKDQHDAAAKAGALNAGHYMIDRNMYYGLMGEAVDRITKSGGLIITPEMLKSGWEKYGNLLYKSENVNRIAQYQNAFDNAKGKGMNDYDASLYAAAQSRGLIDFAVAGHVMKIVNQLIPFSNAAVQGLRSSAKAASKDPAGFAGRLMLYSILPQVAFWMMNHGDDDDEKQYENLPDYQRDMFYNIKIGDNKWLSIPKPFELGLVASGVDRAMSYAKGFKKAFEGYVGSVAKAMFPFDDASISGPLQKAVEIKTNYDFFRDQNIIPPHEMNLRIALRNTETASRLGKILGKISDSDPRMIDHFVRGQFSYFGSAAMKLSDIGRTDTRNKFGISDTGVMKEFSAYSSKPVQDFLTYSKENGLTRSGMYQIVMLMSKDYFNEKDEKIREQKGLRLIETTNKILESWKRVKMDEMMDRKMNPVEDDDE